jgi:putative transposase
MDGHGRWMDNVFIERLWRSMKYECVFLNAFETGGEARTGIGHWIDFYKERRPHSKLGWQTPQDYATKFHPRRDLALRYADGSAPDPAAHLIDKTHPNRWSELTTG